MLSWGVKDAIFALKIAYLCKKEIYIFRNDRFRIKIEPLGLTEKLMLPILFKKYYTATNKAG